MSKRGPIIVVEDDQYDIDIILEAIQANGVKNEIIVFKTAEEAYNHLIETNRQPFLILCDIRMPKINGIEFRKRINDNEYLKKKSIPFIFFTEAISQEVINEAYALTVQGIFQKASNFEGIQEQLRQIITYWRDCLHPNKDIMNV